MLNKETGKTDFFFQNPNRLKAEANTKEATKSSNGPLKLDSKDRKQTKARTTEKSTGF